MIILANRTYGGFHHTRECVEHFNLRSCYNRTDFENRIDPELIDFYHHHDRGGISLSMTVLSTLSMYLMASCVRAAPNNL